MKQVVSIAGPAGSGKNSIIDGITKRYSNTVFAVNATTRKPREGEIDGISYHFLTKDEFLQHVAEGTIPEHYHRPDTDTYYGLFKPDLDRKIAEGKTVFFQIQIVGAKYLKENYGAVSIFIMPPSLDAFERRIRERSPMSDAEWQERKEFTEREVKEESPWYDYRIHNYDGKLSDAVDQVVEILEKEGYHLLK
jgi:guanylate kinase